MFQSIALRSMYLIVVVFGALLFGAISAHSVHGAMNNIINNNKPAINTIDGIVGPTTIIALKDNGSTAYTTITVAGNTSAASNNTTSNNVTAASGNNGHIYRGGAAAGSGGE